MKNEAMRSIPGVDRLLEYEELKPIRQKYGDKVIVTAIQSVVEDLRNKLLHNDRTYLLEDNSIDFTLLCREIAVRAAVSGGSSLFSVINATGILIHTNLGRAPLGETVYKDIESIVKGYCNLEYNLSKGKRGQRNSHIIGMIRFLTGAEDAIVVNNNAAGLLLTLQVLAQDKEVITSRGELVEIGGSFRIPDVIAVSGAEIVEVGTTNRTRISDYENAITGNTAVLLKTHKSNFTIEGFTEEASIAKLAELAHKNKLTVVYDLGSGLLHKPGNLALENEPDVHSAFADGADIVTFSCDKLLGGPQGGIVAGKRELIQEIGRHPLMRALRVGKLTIAALASVLRRFLSEDYDSLPLFSALSRSPEQLRQLAEELSTTLKNKGVNNEVIASSGRPGGGALPSYVISSWAVKLQLEQEAEEVFKRLLQGNTPVEGVLREGSLLFDVLTLQQEQFVTIANAVALALNS